MRLETIIAKALERTNNDRYLLAVVVSKRAEELNKGAETELQGVDLQKDKLADIAIKEVAEGLVDINAYTESLEQ
jgi:DNA-directed RNA polymerase subunit omega